MRTLNFKKQFAPLVESGEKRQTIRRGRKNPIKRGDPLYLCTGQRTSKCRKLKDAICKDVSYIEVHDHYIMLESQMLSPGRADLFAILEGFKDRHEMIAFLDNKYGLPFYGVLIEW